MDRRQAVLAPLDMSGRGIEIAPYFNPFLDKSDHDVVYTDYLSTEDLRAKAAANPTAVQRVVPEIDFVWAPGKPLKDCISTAETFDYALASHVVEHVPNTIGWLNDILAVLKDGATLALLVPNKRGTCDYYRDETTLSDLVGAFIENRVNPTSSQIFDFVSRSVEDYGIRPQLFGDGYDFNSVKRSYTNADAINFAIEAYLNSTYLDIHCTVWTEQSFVRVFREVVAFGLMNVAVSEAIVTGPDEFIVHITKLGEPAIKAPRPNRTEPVPYREAWWRASLKKTPVGTVVRGWRGVQARLAR